jgi:hypothetical protein
MGGLGVTNSKELDHISNLVKIRSLHLLPIFYLVFTERSKKNIPSGVMSGINMNTFGVNRVHSKTYMLILSAESNLFYVTFQGNIEIGSHKTGGHLIQVSFILYLIDSLIKIRLATLAPYFLLVFY